MSGNKGLPVRDVQFVIMCNDSTEGVVPYGTSGEDALILERLRDQDRERWVKARGDTPEIRAQYSTIMNWQLRETPITTGQKRKLISNIEVSFPVPVEISDGWEEGLYKLLCELSLHHNVLHPAQVMWLSGYGDKPTRNWFLVDEDNPQEFEEHTLKAEFTSRANYHITDRPTAVSIIRKLTEWWNNSDRARVWSVASIEWQHQTKDFIEELILEAYAVGRKDGMGEPAARALGRTILGSSDPSFFMLAGILASQTDERYVVRFEALQKIAGNKFEISHIQDDKAGGVVLTFINKLPSEQEQEPKTEGDEV